MAGALALTALFVVPPGLDAAEWFGGPIVRWPWLLGALVLATLALFVAQTRANPDGLLVSGSAAIFFLAYAGSTLLVDEAGKQGIVLTAAWLAAGFFGAALWPSVGMAMRGLVGLACVQAAYTLFASFAELGGVRSGTLYRTGGTFEFPLLVSVLLVVALAAATGLLVASRPRPWIVAAVALLAAAVLVTWFRNNWISLLIAIPIVLARARVGRSTIAIVALLLVLALGGTALNRNASPANRRSTAGSNVGRAELWRSGLNQIAERPWTGAGVGNSATPIPSKEDPTATEYSILDPKNQLVFVVMELGVPGGALFLLLVGSALRQSAAAWDAAQSATFAGLLAFVGLGIFDTPMLVGGRELAGALFAFLIGCAVRLGVDAKRACVGARSSPSEPLPVT